MCNIICHCTWHIMHMCNESHIMSCIYYVMQHAKLCVTWLVAHDILCQFGTWQILWHMTYYIMWHMTYLYVRHDTNESWHMTYYAQYTLRSDTYATHYTYGVASIRRLLKMIGLFCKRALQKRLYSAKETYNFMEPTNRSHPIMCCIYVTMGWLRLVGSLEL